jgi:hypothetical protein
MVRPMPSALLPTEPNFQGEVRLRRTRLRPWICEDPTWRNLDRTSNTVCHPRQKDAFVREVKIQTVTKIWHTGTGTSREKEGAFLFRHYRFVAPCS